MKKYCELNCRPRFRSCGTRKLHRVRQVVLGQFLETCHDIRRAFTRIHSSWIKSSGKYKGRTNFKLCAWKYLSSLSILACDGFLRDFFQLRVKSCQSCCQIKVDLMFFFVFQVDSQPWEDGGGGGG